MSRRGNPYDNAKAESFMKTLKVEAVYLAAYETFEDVTADLPRWLLLGFGVVLVRHATKPAIRAPSRAMPRRRVLCTNWKKPR